MDATPGPMTSQRPYLLRALYEWVVDNGMTPHLLVDARMPGVRVPAHAVEDGRIVLNIAERAVARLDMGADAIRFTARFGGISQAVVVPLPAVIAIYARETGQGMALPPESRDDGVPADVDGDDEAGEAPGTPPGDEPDGPRPPQPPKRGHLRIVK
jgi:stringent starvation protein B